jgi:predicted dehydrogenase
VTQTRAQNSSRTKVALVGARGYGASYLTALLDNTGHRAFDLVGVVDPHPSRSVRHADMIDRGIPRHTDVSSLFAATPEINLTILATPIQLHASQILMALSYDSNVLCEKPLAATAEDALAVAAAEAARGGQFVAVGFQWSFSRAVQALKRDVMAGVFGKPVRLRTLVIFPRGDNYYRRNGWAGRVVAEDGLSVYDSPLNNAAAHYLHNMLYVLGPTRATSASPKTVESELYRANDIESFDTAALRSTTSCGVELLFYTTHASPRRVGPICRFEFERAVVQYAHVEGGGGGGEFVAQFSDGTTRGFGAPEIDRALKLWQSVDAAAGGPPVSCGAAAAVPHALCVSASRQSFPDVQCFPESAIRRETVADEMMTCVDGLAEVLTDCYERAAMPSELGVPWARAGRRVDVSTSAQSNSALRQ